jgi:hypothetical protein
MTPSVRVAFTDYALWKMRKRDVLEEEVIRVLARPQSAHRHRKDGRSDVRGPIHGGQLLVVYRQRRHDLLVITVMRA